MKKIKDIRDLKSERERLHLYEENLEYRMKDNLQDLKNYFHPKNIAKQILSKWFGKNQSETSHLFF